LQDVAIVFGATSSGEFLDRNDLTLDNGAVPSTGQDALMTAVGQAAKAAAKPSIGVVVTPGSLLTPWAASLDAVLYAFMPGMEWGNVRSKPDSRHCPPPPPLRY